MREKGVKDEPMLTLWFPSVDIETVTIGGWWEGGNTVVGVEMERSKQYNWLPNLV